MENLDGEKKKVLAIDDDQIMHKLLVKALQQSYVVQSASNSEEAIPLLFSSPPDVITLDLSMPGLGGHDLLTTLKIWQPQIPVLVLSATTDQEMKDDCLDKGAFTYTEKPFKKDLLLQQIANAVSEESRESDNRISDEIQLLELELVMKVLQKKGLITQKEALNEIKRIRSQRGRQ